MSYMLFIDESGQDLGEPPYAVLAGIAVEDRDLWNLICRVQDVELEFFGRRVSDGLLELKGKKLLKSKTFRQAAQREPIPADKQRDLARALLEDGVTCTRERIIGLAQAKLAFVSHMLALCGQFRVKGFASMVDRDAPRPEGDFLRKDYAYLFERYFYFLEDRPGEQLGLVVFDELERSQCHILIDQMARYFCATARGQARASLVIPEPFFVHGHLTTAISRSLHFQSLAASGNGGHLSKAFGCGQGFHQSGAAVLGERSMATAQDVLLPDIGDFSEVEVIEILVQPGDRVGVDQPLITLESDKATMEIPSPLAGEVVSIAVAVGDKLSQGDPVLTLAPQAPAVEAQTEVPAAAPEETPAEPPEEIPPAEIESIPEPMTELEAVGPRPGEVERRRAPVLPRPADLATIAKGRKPHASPAVRRFARELGVDLTLVEGSGPKHRILKTDVQDHVKKNLARGAAAAPDAGLPFRLPLTPEIDYAKFGEVEFVPLPRIKKISGSRLHLNWISAPQVTQHDAADITDLEAFRASRREAAAKEGVKLTFLPLLMKAVAKALDRFPNLKASLTGDGERLVLKGFTHLGVAVDAPDGLVVPVIRDVDQKGIYALARELTETSAKAREGKLLPGDMQGGCFTISSLGGIGGTAFTPIINVPEVAILGVSRAEMKPVWNGNDFIPRRILPLSLSYDHRVIDGAEAARFTGLLRELLEDIRSLLL